MKYSPMMKALLGPWYKRLWWSFTGLFCKRQKGEMGYYQQTLIVTDDRALNYPEMKQCGVCAAFYSPKLVFCPSCEFTRQIWEETRRKALLAKYSNELTMPKEREK